MTRLRFGWLQLVLGLLLIGLAAWLGHVMWLLVWPGIAVALIGLGYLQLGPEVFGKGPDGRLHPLRAFVLLPYHVVAFLRMHWDFVRHREDTWNEVAEGLYLGRRTMGALPPGTTCVIDVTAELPAIAGVPGAIEYHLLATLDATAPSETELTRLVERLAPRREHVLYVHCAAGHGRSATVAAALLVARGLADDAQQAEALLQKARPLVRLHREQRDLVARVARAWKAGEGPRSAR